MLVKPKISTDVNSHGYFSELFLGQIQWVIVGSDAMSSPLWPWWQICSQKAVIHHVNKRHHGMPSFVIVPHLSTEKKSRFLCTKLIKAAKKDPTNILCPTIKSKP